ncbi:O-antigen ligase family protein [Mesorhizobium sp. BAC0120]|uniref:O-antigen ligase family protein n=1 Tax=Mesorhizobium sp. BAC0120 TaxID=3090670 RepID=UPI00298C7E61|nr:O-antigen ligase family protein [Mesorhizobium sp. BAC0120]MDW6025035.1 O-antigen ligase family protein [Mesorhizobium sp. BAC0120]
MSTAEAVTRRCGNPIVFLTLVLSLVINIGAGGLLLLYLAALALVSRLRLVVQSFRNFTLEFCRSDIGRMYLVVSGLTLIVLFLSFYHREWGELEVALKRFFIAYVVVNFIWKYSTRLILDGAAVGALLACVVAVVQVVWLGADRAEGPTNAIRFGMIAALFSAVSLAGAMFSIESRVHSMFYGAAGFGGLVATFFSGSRGALLALPFMLAPLALRLVSAWSWRRLALLFAYILVAFALFVSDGGKLRTRTETALIAMGLPQETAAGHEGQSAQEDQSAHIRRALLVAAFDLFRKNVWLGAGYLGWTEAIAGANSSPNPEDRLKANFNQAHNQYANDLAKGGLLRGAAGLAFVLVPLLFFLRARPFSDWPATMPALLGVIVVLGFGAFSLTESVMVLSLPASLYSLLVFYLLGAKEESWSKSA